MEIKITLGERQYTLNRPSRSDAMRVRNAITAQVPALSPGLRGAAIANYALDALSFNSGGSIGGSGSGGGSGGFGGSGRGLLLPVAAASAPVFNFYGDIHTSDKEELDALLWQMQKRVAAR